MIRNKRITKSIAVFFVLTMLLDIVFPVGAYALTGGPSQPEVQSFEPIGTSEMVDVFSGDFTYNIPLMDVGGYPINISYNAGIGMDQEASWVGLGWNINPGAITRNMRSLPDDFDSDMIKKEFNIKTNHTYGVNVGASIEAFGFEALKNVGLDIGLGLSYNNYRGVGFEASIEPSISAGKGSKSSLNAGLGLSASSTNGVGINPTVSFDKKIGEEGKNQTTLNTKIGLGFNSREGLKELSLSANTTIHKDIKNNKGKTRAGFGISPNGGANISFTTPTYIPQVNLPMVNANFSLGGKFGTAVFGTDVTVTFGGYYSGQYLSTKEQNFPAFGYLYAQNGVGDRVMLDFNREKDGSFTPNTPNLPVTNFTYDVYSVAGQGIGGMYRPYRSDVGVLYDSKQTNTGGGAGVDDIEIGAGGIFKAGVNVSVNFSQSSSGKWVARNELNDNLKFKGKDQSSDPLYEPVYFKQAGEKTAETDLSHLESMGGFDPVRVGIDGDHSASLKRFEKDNGTSVSIGGNGIERKTRQRRNQAITYLTAEEASKFGLEKSIKSYGDYDLTARGRYVAAQQISRLDYPKHHISEISTLRADGARYVFGIPAYNNSQVESTFAINGEGDCVTGLVSYSASDDSKNNDQGLDNYFNRVTMPKYAHSYLLTAVLSPDYVDLTGDGPSDDDLGSYTKINYTRAIPEYKWRTPYTKANFSEGLKSSMGQSGDNKASYVYGTKDVWYVHSMESRTHVAEFILQDRADSYGVTGTSGGRGAQTLKKLVRIDLYAKPEKKNNPSPSPIKSVHFEYDYSLFSAGSGLPNNNGQNPDSGGFSNQGGKLTLKKIFFTYENSHKGRLSPYEFHYADMDHDGVMDVNYAYNLKGYDRWGNYKTNPSDATCASTGSLSTAEFPYVDQDRATSDQYAAAWSLTSIDLPSGGTIKVNYEADDYAYVQDRPAMQMFKISGAGNDPSNTPTSGDLLMTSGNQNNNFLFFELDQPMSTGEVDPKSIIKRDYIKGLQTVYFRFLMNVTGGGKYEFVPGYAEIQDYGVATTVTGGSYTHGYIKLKAVNLSDSKLVPGEDANPISRTAWQFARLYMPIDAYNQPDVGDNGLTQILESLLSAFGQIEQFIQGINRDLRDKGFGKQFVQNKSWIRLYNPDGMKLGGGVRVKKVALSDSWDTMTGNGQAEYGQEYNYTKEDEFGNIISSGVASYEPMIGGDENPFRQPVAFSNERLLAPSDDYYLEEPFGESFFPGASVGYSRVEVRNLQYENVKKNATGSVVHEFYTSRDFPTIVSQTRLKSKRKRPTLVLSILKLNSKDFMTASQGYAIELNDMNGKPKAQWVYPENSEDPISGVEYFYRQKTVTDNIVADGVTKQVQRLVLDNEIEVIEKDGTITQNRIGVDYDFAVDMRESESLTTGGKVNINVDGFVLGIIPIVVPVALPGISIEKTRFNSAVTTKVINRYGLMDRVVAYDLGSSVATKNLLYDGQTGEVLLTETTNQFSDPVYSFTYPAHWAYDRMGSASMNVGLSLGDVNLSNISSASDYFVQGDEIALEGSTGKIKAWVAAVSETGIVAIDSAGYPVPNDTYDLKILRSGRRNQQAVSIGSVTNLTNPLYDSNDDGNYDMLVFDEVINSGAVEFSEEWETFCNCGRDPSGVHNPYVYGSLGNWRAKRSSLFLTERTQSKLNNNVDMRHDGIYKDFAPFWTPPVTDGEWGSNPEKWTFTSEVTLFSPYGFELENRDALDRYSAALYGYNNILPTAVANNSRFKEAAFDGFEDYDFDECQDDHFSFRNFSTQRVQSEAHTGRNSIKVMPGSSVEVEKIITVCQDEEQQ
jgi:hypothetical protein